MIAHPAVERYRHAVAQLSRAQEMRRTAVQHVDSYRWRYAVEDWKREVREALDALPAEFRTPPRRAARGAQ